MVQGLVFVCLSQPFALGHLSHPGIIATQLAVHGWASMTKKIKGNVNGQPQQSLVKCLFVVTTKAVRRLSSGLVSIMVKLG